LLAQHFIPAVQIDTPPPLWLLLLGQGGIGAIILLILGAWLKRNQSKFENEQKAKLASFQSTLDEMSFEHQTRYAHLHESRAKVIEELYSRLVETEDAWSSLLSPGKLPQTKEAELEEETRAIKAANDYRWYVRRKRIYFDIETCSALEAFDSAVFLAWVQWYVGIKGGKKYGAEWRQAWAQISNVAPATRRQLEQVFRSILGVTKTR
jgi:hypothetical protein